MHNRKSEVSYNGLFPFPNSCDNAMLHHFHTRTKTRNDHLESPTKKRPAPKWTRERERERASTGSRVEIFNKKIYANKINYKINHSINHTCWKTNDDVPFVASSGNNALPNLRSSALVPNPDVFLNRHVAHPRNNDGCHKTSRKPMKQFCYFFFSSSSQSHLIFFGFIQKIALVT